MTKDVIQQMYASFPDGDVFDPEQAEDLFLVGDGSAHLMRKVQTARHNSSEQLTGINSVNDLRKVKEAEEFRYVVQDDLSSFAQEATPLSNPEEYLFTSKRECLDKFGFLEEKSKQFVGRPIRERDLVLNEDDSYLLHYMEGQGYINKQAVWALAQLSACRDMGFSEVKFAQLDGCALCEAYNGTVYKVSDLISRLGSGQYLSHEGCFCDFIPVITDRRPFKDIQNGLTLSAYIGEVYFERLPLEFVDFMTDNLIRKIPYKRVVFQNFNGLKGEDIERYEITNEDVIIDLGETLWIRDNYILSYSPFDFLNSWLSCMNEKPIKLEDESLSEGDIFYLNGKKVIERSGSYIDIETGEVISLLGGD